MAGLKDYPISLHEVFKASQIVSQHLNPTPLVKYDKLSQWLGFNAYVKHENQNITGSFKIRGGINLMSHIKKAGISGVITFSTGNHGLSVATAARRFGLPAIVVVPENSNPVKIKLIQETGATLVEGGKNFDQASLVVAELSDSKGYYEVHPANEPHLINGVGTGFLEVIQEQPEIDTVLLPLGGGSEVAAAVTTLKAIHPAIDIIAVQAELSSAAYHSWQQGQLLERANETFAGGFATGTAYPTTFDIYKDSLTDFILLSEHEILQGIALAAYYTKNLVEGAGGSTLMAAWKLREQLAGKNVVLQLSGANASPTELQQACPLSTFTDGQIC